MATATQGTTWQVPQEAISVSAAGTSTGKSITLNTSGKYIDRDITIAAPTTTIADGAITTSAPTVTSGSASMTATGVKTTSSGDYYITLSTTAGSAKSNAGVSTAGWVETTDTATDSSATSVSVSGNGNKVYITASDFGASSVGSKTYTSGDSTQTLTISEGYTKGGTITINPLSSGSAATFTGGDTSVDNSTNVATRGVYSNTAGYAAQSDTRLAAATFSNTATSGVTYVDVSNALVSSGGSNVIPVLTSDDGDSSTDTGYLYINKGYVDNLKVSLAHLVPDLDGYTMASSDQMLSGKTLYDVDGKPVTGSIATKTQSDLTASGATVTVPAGYYASEATKSVATATVSPSATGTATITSITPSYSSTAGNFSVSGSASITGTASSGLSGAGYVASAGTGSTSGTASVSASLAKIALTATKSSGNLTVAPTLARTAKPSSDTWTDGANGAATTTKPASGVYIQIDAAAATNTLKVKPEVGTAGYGDTTNYGYTEYSASVGAAKATTAYVPVKTGSASVTAGTIAGSASDPTLNSSTGNYDITFSASGTVNGSATAGWVSSVTGATVTSSATKSLAAAALTHDNTATETVAVATLKATATNNINTATSGSYYITVGKDSQTAGSVVHTASVSEGYVPSAGLSQEATIPTSANVTAKTFYLASTTLTNSVTATLTGATTNYSAPVTVSASSSTPQLCLTGSGSGTTKSVLASNGTAATKYIDYYTGAYTTT